MCKACSLPAVTIVVLVGGCAAAPIEPVADPSGAAAVPLPPRAQPYHEPDMVIDISQPADDTRCEDVTRPGSRIVVSRRCWSPGREVEDEEKLAGQLEQVRRDQDELERRQRDIEAQRRAGFGGM
jgi:hypothetical protein